MEQKQTEETKKTLTITDHTRHLLVIVFDLIGTILALYVGGYLLFLRPIYRMVVAYRMGTLVLPGLLRGVIAVVMASTAGGGIWCVFDIIAGIFRDKED